MNLFGDLFSDYDSMTASPAGENRETSIVIKNGIFDDLLISSDINDYGKYSTTGWNASTLVFCAFNGSLIGGNIDYQLGTIQSLRLKRREVGSYNWITLYEKPIASEDDLIIAYIDYYAKGRETNYEYGIAPVVNGVEQSMDLVQVKSSFDGAIITDGNTTYHLLFDVGVSSITRNRACGTVLTLNGKYPFVFYGSKSNYETGNFSATVLKTDITNDTVDLGGSVQYRAEFADWLTNGNPKILKMFDGRSWMIEVNGNISQDSSEHMDKMKFSFDFIEIGNVQSSTDMYDNGFINTNVEGS